MDEYLKRQISILCRSLEEYREGLLHLNTLILRIEEISDAIGDQPWKDAVYPIILELEQVNAAVMNTKSNLNTTDSVIVEKSLLDLEKLIKQYPGDAGTCEP